MIPTHCEMKNHTHLTEEFDRLVTKCMQDWHVPGLAIAVVREDTVDAKVGACLLISLCDTTD